MLVCAWGQREELLAHQSSKETSDVLPEIKINFKVKLE